MPSVALLDAVVAHCDRRLGLPDFPDFPGAHNGLQCDNDGRVKRIGAAVDADFATVRRAAAGGVDFLLVHHGMFWGGAKPIIGTTRDRLQLLFAHNIALYSAHLPLDAHPELGNNALLAARLGLEPCGTFAPFQGINLGLLANAPAGGRAELQARLRRQFSGAVTAIEFGAEHPERVGLVSGGGSGALDDLVKAGVDTLVTGELKQSAWFFAQEHRLNLYLAGHYATETFGVAALAAELAGTFGLPWEFLASECPL
jgi:dinuclear metal center YbgI/SA1388 family protein